MNNAKSINSAPKGCGKWVTEDDGQDVNFHCGNNVLGITMLCPDCKKLNEQGSKE